MKLLVYRCLALGGVLYLLATQGCGASQLEHHVKAAQVTRSALDVAAAGIESACDPEAVAARPDAQERAGRCLGAAEAHDTARVAWVSYASALVLAAEEGKVSVLQLLPLGSALVDAYREVAEAVAFFGGAMPPLPEMLEGF